MKKNDKAAKPTEKKKRNPFLKKANKPRDTDEEETKNPLYEKRDKIFDNDFNIGNINTENLPNIHIETDFATSYLDDCYNTEEYVTRKDLTEKVLVIFNDSQWSTLPLDKKFSKELMPFIFNDLYKGLSGQGYTTVDIFICIAEFMDVSYEKVYEVAGVKVKELLIKEMELKYKILSKKKINRLF